MSSATAKAREPLDRRVELLLRRVATRKPLNRDDQDQAAAVLREHGVDPWARI
jgi:hypothetical protein